MIAGPFFKRGPSQSHEWHLKRIRELPCLITGERREIDAAHIRMGDLAYGKPHTGGQEKPHDMWTVPLRHDIHMEQHGRNEREWWKQHGLNPLIIASLLWAHSTMNDTTGMIEVVLSAEQISHGVL